MCDMTNSRRKQLLFVALALSVGLIIFASFDTYARPELLSPSIDFESSTETNQSTPSSTRILLASAFFPLSKSKHSTDDYISWQTRFLSCITTEIYYFTTPDLEPVVRQLRGDLPITINTSYSSPFSIPPLHGLEERYNEMHEWDRENKRHSPELYAVWNGKPYFLDEAVKNMRLKGKEYDYAFWNDAGSFRNEYRCTAWPDPGRVDDIWQEGSKKSGKAKEDLIFFPITGVPHRSMRLWEEIMGPVDNEFSEGSFFGGSPKTVTWWSNLYYAYHDAYLSNDIFVGKDQTLINSLFLLFPGRIITVWFRDPVANHDEKTSVLAPARRNHSRALTAALPLVNCGSEWFYYQWWLSSTVTRKEMADYWLLNASLWDWLWKGRCELRGVLVMEEVLKRMDVFGPGWTAPKASLSL